MIAVGTNGRIEVDDFFLTITKESDGGSTLKVLNRVASGFAGEKRIPIDSISSVQFKPVGTTGSLVSSNLEKIGLGKIGKELGAGATGYIQFAFMGSQEHKNRVITNNWSLWKDENTVLFSIEKQEDFRKIKEFIENKVVQRQNGVTGQGHPAKNASPTTEKFDQLKQLGELKASGILTEEEFQEQKQRILGV
jgi:hypothetical protein